MSYLKVERQNEHQSSCLMMINSILKMVILLILRVWESLSDATCCRSLIIVYDKRVILQIGFATASSNTHDAVVVDVDKLMKGSLYQGALKSKSRKRPAFTFIWFWHVWYNVYTSGVF